MKKKSVFSTVALVLVLLIGLSLLLYPSFSDYWNSSRQTQVIMQYAEGVAKLDNEVYDAVLESARNYNESLVGRPNPYLLDDAQMTRYLQELNIATDGVMGYVEIPSIDVSLPMYHGVEEKILQVAVGHLDWTSLPVGGASTHCVLSGHRGLPSARLFTDLDKLAVGDLFMLHILDETMTYEVDQIKIVEPHETEDLLIEEGKDLVTLVTCTPYGVNSHRLLVRGHRVENLEEVQVVRVTADAVIIEKLVVAPFLMIPVLFAVVLILLIPKRKNRRDEE